MVAVAIVTLFPIVYDDVTEYTDTITWYNFIPFKTIVSAFQNVVTTTAITQIIGNIALAVPFGIMVLMLFKLPHWWQKLLIALSFTIAIELSQLCIGLSIGNMYRNIDIDDVILNLSGTYIGYGIYATLYNMRKVKLGDTIGITKNVLYDFSTKKHNTTSTLFCHRITFSASAA